MTAIAPSSKMLVLAPVAPDDFIKRHHVLAGSALICKAGPDGAPERQYGNQVRFAYEGNANGAVNLVAFRDKAKCAAGRLKTDYPSVAYGMADLDEMKVVAEFDADRWIVSAISDPEELSYWADERAELISPRPAITPCRDAVEIDRLLKSDCQVVLIDPKLGIMSNGQIIVSEQETGAFAVFSREDKELHAILDPLGLDEDTRTRILGAWRPAVEDEVPSP